MKTQKTHTHKPLDALKVLVYNFLSHLGEKKREKRLQGICTEEIKPSKPSKMTVNKSKIHRGAKEGLVTIYTDCLSR